MSDYALITPEGELTFGDGEWRDRIGPEGPSRVPFNEVPGSPFCGWVNDCGLVLPDRYPRNVVGGIAAIILGARPQPYAGPVVITGWHCCPVHGAYEHDLAADAVDYLRGLVGNLRAALDSREVDPAFIADCPDWPSAVRATAEMIRTADAPPIQITVDFPLGGLN